MDRRQFLQIAAGAAASAVAGGGSSAFAQGAEWRNRQSGMRYRPLGRTGMMVSEFVCGGNTISPKSNDHVRLAMDLGLNYLDTAPAYGRGESETGYGLVLKDSSQRQRVFLASKVSLWDLNRNDTYRKMFESLPEADQKRIKGEADEYLRRLPGRESDYFGNYFGAQWGEVESAALSNAMERHYGSRLDRKAQYTGTIIKSVEESLRRLNTDHLDVLHCPHGASTPAEMNIAEVFEAFERLKKDGKVRFLGYSSHSDPAGTLRAAVADGHYSVAMIAYSVTNHDTVDPVVREAAKKGVGVIAMKAARPVWANATTPGPKHRVEKLDKLVPGAMKIPMKAYLWVLQNKDIAAINSELISAEMVKENLPLSGRKI